MRYFLLLWLLLFMVMPVMACGEGRAARIISLGPVNTENIYLLGAQERLVANTDYCLWPEAARAKAKIGSVLQINIEKIVALRPDLILATGLSQPQQIEKLQGLGLKVVQFGQPSSFADICAHFMELGRLVGLEARAARIVEEARARVTLTRQRVALLSPQKVFLQVGLQPLFSAVEGSFTHDFIDLAGGINIARRQSRGTVRLEKVIAENPDVIIVAVMGSDRGMGARQRQRWLDLRVMEAARQQRVHALDPHLVCSPSPLTFADTLELMARLIHPDVFRSTALEERP
ncbi:MAG: ABC transporter substrate-binding protein [Desulfurivibrionaceae bacterium]|nr:ABC transporter substrate-binding protein [Desulfurivibrionaceae bacterium]